MLSATELEVRGFPLTTTLFGPLLKAPLKLLALPPQMQIIAKFNKQLDTQTTDLKLSSSTITSETSETLKLPSFKVAKVSSNFTSQTQPEITKEYAMLYELNRKTGRMNKVWRCRGKNCKRMFRRVSSLQDHLRIHRADKPFKCTLCGRSWAQIGNRDRHLKQAQCLVQIADQLEDSVIDKRLTLMNNQRKAKK